jgi:hypothetical protein
LYKHQARKGIFRIDLAPEEPKLPPRQHFPERSFGGVLSCGFEAADKQLKLKGAIDCLMG